MESYDIKGYIIRQFKPSCIVFSSAQAKQICKENNLSPAELLRPFADMSKEQLPISVSEKYSSTLRDFALDFYDSSDYERSPASVHFKARRAALESNAPLFSFKDVRFPKRNSWLANEARRGRTADQTDPLV